MGARAQVLIKDTGVCLYDHSGAADDALIEVVHTAISRGKRWDDPGYLAAIIFRELVKDGANSLDDSDSLGIDTFQHTDIQLLVTVDCDSKIIMVDRNPMADDETKHELSQCSFEDFSTLGPGAVSPVILN